MNWLAVCVLVFLMLAALAGARRGLIKSAFSFTSFFLTIIIVSLVREPVTEYLRENTALYRTLEDSFRTLVENSLGDAANGEKADEGQAAIERLSLPGLIKDSLLARNRSLVYQELGVTNVAEYVTASMVRLAFQALCYIITFAAVWVVLRIVMALLCMIARLPVIHQIDSAAGAVFGLLIALILVWIAGLVVTACASSSWGSEAMVLISESPLLSFLYNHNILVSGLLRKISL